MVNINLLSCKQKNKQEFKPFQSERNHLGVLIQNKNQNKINNKKKLSICYSQISKKNFIKDESGKKSLADYMTAYQDGSDKANYNIFTKKDIIQENMQFENGNRYSSMSQIQKKGGQLRRNSFQVSFPSIGYYQSLFTQTFQSNKKLLKFNDPNTPKYFIPQKTISQEWMPSKNFKIEQGIQFGKQIDRQKAILQWVPKIKIYSKQKKENKNDYREKLVQEQIKELNYNKLVSNNYKFETQPTISINAKDQTKMPLNYQEIQTKFKQLIKQYQLDEDICGM